MRFAALFFIMLSGSASAANWVTIAAGGDAEVFVDSSSVSPRAAWTKAWFRYEYSAAQKLEVPPKTYLSTLELMYFNCKEKTSAVAQAIYYDGEHNLGANVHSAIYDIDAKSFRDPAPGTFGEAMMKSACAPQKKSR